MMNRTPIRTLVLLLGLCSGLAQAASLADLRELSIRFEFTGVPAGEGPDRTALREAIRQRLEAAGLRVTGPAEAASRPIHAFLVVRLRVDPTPVTHGYTLVVRLERREALPQGQGWLKQTLWSDWKVGGTRIGELHRVEPWIHELVEEFVEAWRRARHGGSSAGQ